MKRFLFLALAVLLMAGTATAVQAQDKKQKKNANLEEVTFVTTIDCKNCVKKVEANLPYEKGIKDLKVNLDDRTVWIKYDPAKTDKEKLAAAIVKLGYEAEELTPEEAAKK
ncbi:MAG: heavy-metal-associated domain-containing protein [Bacteroidales bacterium]|nr:heavy-metal-associated domain-containing protein [Bacteroidales bacterium]